MTFKSPFSNPTGAMGILWDPCAQLRGYDHVGAPVAQSFLDVSLSDFDASTGNPIRLPSGYCLQ